MAGNGYQDQVWKMLDRDFGSESALRFRDHMVNVLLNVLNNQGIGIMEVLIYLFEALSSFKHFNIEESV